jgi:hypothetical protein
LKKIKPEKPTEEQIISILGSFKPFPSERFYHRMDTAPWKMENHTSSKPISIFHRLFDRRGWQPFAVLIVVILLLAGFVIVTPSARVVAQKVVQYFVPAQSDKIAVQVTDTLPIALGTSVPAGYFNLDLAQVESLAGFQLRVIPNTDGELVFSGAYQDPTLDAIAIRYDGDAFTLILSQRRTGDIVEYASIGASAPVEAVMINGIPGEYVEGGWRLEDGDGNKYPTIVPDENFILGIYWDPELPQRVIRWQEGDMIYEIMALGGVNPPKHVLINIAESIELTHP